MGIEAIKEGSHLILFQINQLAGDPSAAVPRTPLEWHLASDPVFEYQSGMPMDTCYVLQGRRPERQPVRLY
jgi:hypothetical protein